MSPVTLVFDFDGTVAIGDGPVLAYARAVGEGLGPQPAADLLAALSNGLNDLPGDCADGYQLVQRLAEGAGVDSGALNDAYRRSRALLGTDQAPVAAPAGLSDFLAELPGHCQSILVTNSPAIRLADTIELLGLGGRFAEVHSSAAKPDGLLDLARPWAEQGPVLGIGDIWRNDLEPIKALGGDTALIGMPAAGQSPTMHAESLAELVPQIWQWLGEHGR